MKSKELIEINDVISHNLIEYFLLNSFSSSSNNRGNSPSVNGYENIHYSKIELGFDDKLGLDIVNIFFQRKEDRVGRMYKLSNVDNSMFDICLSFYLYKRDKRHNTNISIDMLSKVNTVATKSKEPSVMLLDCLSD